MITGSNLHFPSTIRPEVVGVNPGRFAYQSDFEKDGGGPLDAPDTLPAGSMYRLESWSGLEGWAWAYPETCGRGWS